MVPAASFAVTRNELRVVMERIFDAPREVVFNAFTDPNAVPRWWGLRRHTTTVDKMDVRVGGAWRYVCRDADGHTYAFNGVYKRVAPPTLEDLDGMVASGMESGATESWQRLAEFVEKASGGR